MTKFSAPQQNQLAQIGAFLRENREKQEKSLEDIAIRTYIRPQLLNGIETGNPDTLPEPIFVQGFIRRYGEALGLNGIELSQQFTVSSIPATPRPAPPAPLTDTPTTRLTRASTGQSPDPAPQVPSSIPLIPANQSAQQEDLTLGRIQADPVVANVAADSAVSNVVQPDNVGSDAFESAASAIAEADASPAASFGSELDDGSVGELTASEDVNTDIPVLDSVQGDGVQGDSAQSDITQGATELETNVSDTDLPVADLPDEEQDFSSMVAAFDQENMGQADVAASTLDTPSEVGSVALNEQAPLSNTNANFDDDLPAAFTTEASAASAPSALQQPTVTQSTPASNWSDSGYEANQPNLKPFVLGGVLAAIALLGVLIASVIGGSRQPSVADTPESVEQVEEQPSDLPPLPGEDGAAEAEAEPEEVAAISDAPIYVEGTAVREAWVSIVADNETVFEGTLQSGDSQLWEAQESLSIFSGDAGALELAANGEDAEVMGESGIPEEKVFP